ncbi:MAG: DsrE family protein [Xanthomonadales bacterium]|nr:DsrE family protein [Xanthomonadales bacterium]
MKWMITITDAPFVDGRARERLDLALMALALDHQVSVVFAGEGVLQLVPDRQSGPIRDFTRAIGSLALYGARGVYASAGSLRRYGLTPDQLTVQVEVLDDEGLARMRQDQEVLS